MWKYILKRLLMMIPIVLGVVIFVFTIMYLSPGDPAVVILGQNATEAQLMALREKMGFNEPYLVQLGNYLNNLFFKFDLGNSYITGVSVMKELANRIPNTIRLSLITVLLSIVIGVSLGVFAAVHQGKVGDYCSMIISLIGNSMPGFWFALILVLVFAYHLNWLPAFGSGGFQYWILPVMANAANSFAMQARQTRSSMLEVIHSDYIIMARAKGLKERDVIIRHALPNALIPVIMVAGTGIALALGGGLVVETVFSIPGVGYYIAGGVQNRDYTVVMGSTILISAFFSFIMLMTDLVMATIDPKIKSQFVGSTMRKRAVKSK